MSTSGQLTIPVADHDHVQGASDAPLTVVEYGDYECPYCGQAAPVVKELQSHFGESLRFVFRNLPLTNMHPHAQHAAEVAEAVGVQGLFWEIHDTLYEHQEDLSDRALLTYAGNVGADAAATVRDASSSAILDRIQADVEGALRSGANGTPTFFVNGQRYDGSWELDSFRRELEQVLKRQV
jgi:protein-disulfide isomerase